MTQGEDGDANASEDGDASDAPPRTSGTNAANPTAPASTTYLYLLLMRQQGRLTRSAALAYFSYLSRSPGPPALQMRQMRYKILPNAAVFGKTVINVPKIVIKCTRLPGDLEKLVKSTTLHAFY